MNHRFSILRSVLELITLIAFFYLVVHLNGHAILLLLDHGHADHHHITETVSIVSHWEEWAWGIGISLLFIGIWQKTPLRHLIPCQHEHCHTEKPLSHLLAIGALCLHFFPEAGIRYSLLETFSFQWESVLVLVGFISHILVDILITFHLASYWNTLPKRILCVLFIGSIWGVAFFAHNWIDVIFSHTTEGLFLLISGFILSMFLHLPHKPKSCVVCESQPS